MCIYKRANVALAVAVLLLVYSYNCNVLQAIDTMDLALNQLNNLKNQTKLNIENAVPIALKKNWIKTEDFSVENNYQEIYPLVYPKAFRNGNYSLVSAKNHRNITNNDVTFKPMQSQLKGIKRYDIERIDDQANVGGDGDSVETKYGDRDVNFYHHYDIDHGYGHGHGHANADPHLPAAVAVDPTSTALIGGLGNLIDPVALLGVLALVAFLVNSLLTLLGNLQLINVAKFKPDRADYFLDRFDERNNLHQLLINNLERILRLSFDLYEKKLETQ